MKKNLIRIISILLAVLLSAGTMLTQMVQAQDTKNLALSETGIFSPIYFNFNMIDYDTSKYIKASYWDKDYHQKWALSYSCANRTKKPVNIKIESSNTDVVKILPETETELTLESWDVINGGMIYFENVGVGIADIVVTMGDQVFKKRVYSVKVNTNITKITQTGYLSVTLEWEKVPGCSGYHIECTHYNKKDENTITEVIETIYGDGQTSVTVQGDWGGYHLYKVISFVEDETRLVEEKDGGGADDITLIKKGAEITSVKTSGSDMIVKWDAMEGALRYKLYRSETENGNGICVYTAENDKTSFTWKETVTKGKTHYYKLITVYPEGESDVSATAAQFIPGNGKKKSVECNKFDQNAYRYSYYINTSSSYYYEADGKLHVVRVYQDSEAKKCALKIYTMNSAMKTKGVKTVKLESFDEWGGFYQGIDNNFYVVIGFNNLKESSTKTVIKVIQYNSKWKKIKTASIKGGVSFEFKGISSPFQAGNCRMEMTGTTLYMMTAREMFTGNDGLRHQSNIGFEIDTAKMKAKTMWSGYYVSHSFDQFVKYKDHSLYILDKGDAYPRALSLQIDSEYGDEPSIVGGIFKFKGKTGDNNTGCEVGSMEIGRKNVLVCGSAQPHSQAVRGITGFGNDLAYNAYLILADRKTGKVKFQWLTKYNPKTTAVIVQTPRMVKLADDRFAIIYTTETGNHKNKLHYVVVDDTGKKIYSKTYPDMELKEAVQPILYKGSIVWTQTDWETMLYSIPAVY